MKIKSTTLAALFLVMILFPIFSVSATSVDRTALVNLTGHQGETVQVEISLEGTDVGERVGYWYTSYKEKEGDSDKMDITSWIEVDPTDYTIKQGENITFIVNINIPKDAELGLWGATSKDAGMEGHSDERRTYLVFKDAPSDGNVYSGLLIPISIEVSPSLNPLTPFINFVSANLMIIILSIVIVVLLVMLLLKKKK